MRTPVATPPTRRWTWVGLRIIRILFPMTNTAYDYSFSRSKSERLYQEISKSDLRCYEKSHTNEDETPFVDGLYVCRGWWITLPRVRCLDLAQVLGEEPQKIHRQARLLTDEGLPCKCTRSSSPPLPAWNLKLQFANPRPGHHQSAHS